MYFRGTAIIYYADIRSQIFCTVIKYAENAAISARIPTLSYDVGQGNYESLISRVTALCSKEFGPKSLEIKGDF